jgi:hypothetical protein
MFCAVAVVVGITFLVASLVRDDPWWSVALSPFVGFICGLAVGLIVVLVAVLLDEYVPFWRRKFWRRDYWRRPG